jgi:lysophospholipid acyltransferase (LPLAT)-like uncharacterized protein
MEFSRWQRFQIGFMEHFGALLIRIGGTLHWETRGTECLQDALAQGERIILAFWHNRIVSSTWYWRNRGIVAMTSMNFDGEYIARVLRGFGYGSARGSSSRGGLAALIEMAGCLATGKDVAFAVDGPRGPRYVAKPGPVLLARRTGCPIFCFHISTQRYLQLNSWDRFQVPAPFSRALLLGAPLIRVPADTDREGLLAKQAEVQNVLDALRTEGDHFWSPRP